MKHEEWMQSYKECWYLARELRNRLRDLGAFGVIKCEEIMGKITDDMTDRTYWKWCMENDFKTRVAEITVTEKEQSIESKVEKDE